MKQTIKNYLYLVLTIISIVVIFGIGLVPIIYINNVLFCILYLVILYPMIMLVTYKTIIELYEIYSYRRNNPT